ncbi:Dps family protein [Albirhodobacter sp. R86504]|jgi:starvation-inducible DNA-binding protein|uniref:Dps family protein n=1 Tax=Albirhodobacter sp. R86504 TaxID=3093848 RepID=UPI00367229C8
MADVLTTISTADKVSTGIKAPKKVATELNKALSATYRLLIDTHVTHWNVEGPMFYSIHMLTEAQYGELFEATDVLAERVRALGSLTPMGADALIGKPNAVAEKPSAREMVEALAESHEELARMMHDLAETSEEARDIVTADLATARSGVHEKAAWMLRSMAA